MEDWRTWPNAPEPGAALCKLAEIPDPGAREVCFGEGWDSFRIVLLRAGARVHAYRNRCAHVHIPLNYEADGFHVMDGDVIMCAHHGAMYRIADGYCFEGPCEGASLAAIPVTVSGDVVLIGQEV